jgi:hypothetical protein
MRDVTDKLLTEASPASRSRSTGCWPGWRSGWPCLPTPSARARRTARPWGAAEAAGAPAQPAVSAYRAPGVGHGGGGSAGRVRPGPDAPRGRRPRSDRAPRRGRLAPAGIPARQRRPPHPLSAVPPEDAVMPDLRGAPATPGGVAAFRTRALARRDVHGRAVRSRRAWAGPRCRCSRSRSG